MREAVGWLLGPDLIAKLGKVLRQRVDPRDWMAWKSGFVHDECQHRDGRLAAVQEASTPRTGNAEHEELWFDYIADMGDSSEAMYAIACACQSSFESHQALSVIPKPERQPELRRVPDEAAVGPQSLPRGEFLFIGGDSAYHVADVATIRARVQEPFTWAFDDLGLSERARPRRLYGIPGNHDWYDDLNGFGMLFQRSEPGLGIDLKGFARVQETSYAAIQLAHGWQIWGLDIDTPLDVRQQAYFKSVRDAQSAMHAGPVRLILCTPSPPISLGRVAPHGKHDADLTKLDLAQAYRPEIPLPTESLRLDLSGDMHHYERYQEPEKPGYAAVVSGLGGAFLHPTFTMLQERKPSALYPSADQVLKDVAPRLLSYRSLVVGSWVRAIPFLFCVLLGLASTGTGGLAELLHGWVPALFSEPGEPACPTLPQEAKLCLCPWLSWLCSQLGRAGLLLLVLLACGLLLWLAIDQFNRTALAQAEDPTLRRPFSFRHLGFGPGQAFSLTRSYWPSTSLVVGAALLPIWFAHSSYSPRGSVAGLDCLGLLLLFGFPVAGGIAGWASGAPDGMSVAGKLKITFVGVVHAGIQVATSLLCARLVPAGVPSTREAWLHFKLDCLRGPAAGAFVVCATLFVLLPLTRPLFRRRMPLAIAIVALLTWAGSMAVLYWAAPTHYFVPAGVGAVFYFAVGALAAAFLGPSYVGWYLAVTGLLNGHNNEVGGAARITGYRQMIRFHIDRRGTLTGYVIAIEQVGTPAKANNPDNRLVFKLIDRFSLAAQG